MLNKIYNVVEGRKTVLLVVKCLIETCMGGGRKKTLNYSYSLSQMELRATVDALL